MSDTPDAKGKTKLSDSDIETHPTRRRVIRGLGLGALGVGGTALAGCVPVPVSTGAVYSTGYTDADNGPIVDPGGLGRGPRRTYATGITDADNGPIIDPGGYGRG